MRTNQRFRREVKLCTKYNGCVFCGKDTMMNNNREKKHNFEKRKKGGENAASLPTRCGKTSRKESTKIKAKESKRCFFSGTLASQIPHKDDKVSFMGKKSKTTADYRQKVFRQDSFPLQLSLFGWNVRMYVTPNAESCSFDMTTKKKKKGTNKNMKKQNSFKKK